MYAIFATLLLTCFSPVSAALHQARNAEMDGRLATGVSLGEAKHQAGSTFEGRTPSQGQTVYTAYSGTQKRNLLTELNRTPVVREEPPSPGPGGVVGKLPAWAVYGGAAVVGGLQGWVTGGLMGAGAGIIGGLAGAWLLRKGEYGAALGLAVGGIVGSMMFGPIGGLIGGLLGGLLGWGAQKLVKKLFK
jgi:hypothetical protein